MGDPITLGGLPTLAGSLILHEQGAWTAEVTLGDEDAPTGAALLDFGDGAAFHGTVLRSGNAENRVQVALVGGASGLSAPLRARSYHSATLSLILGDLAREAGETLGAISGATVLQKYARGAGSAGEVLTELAVTAGATWRVLSSGALWLGADTWADADCTHLLLSDDPSTGVLEIAPESPTLVPGQTFLGARVVAVAYAWDATRLRARVWTQGPARDGDFASVFARAVGAQMWPTRYHATYPARVHSQDADGSLQVFPDSPRIPPMVGVPLRTATPGQAVKVLQGARVAVSFENGDPRRPYALACFDKSSATLDEWTVEAQTKLTLRAPAVDLGDTPGQGVVRVADLVQVSISLIVPDPTMGIMLMSPVGPVTGTIGTPLLPVVVTGQAISGKDTVRA